MGFVLLTGCHYNSGLLCCLLCCDMPMVTPLPLCLLLVHFYFFGKKVMETQIISNHSNAKNLSEFLKVKGYFRKKQE